MATTTVTQTEAPVGPTNHTSESPMNKDGPIPLDDRAPSTQVPLVPFPQATGLTVDALERWNRPKINKYRMAAVFFSFTIFGMNDGSYGALVPYVCLKPYVGSGVCLC